MVTARFIQSDETLDYTPTSAVAAGDVVVLGEILGIAKTAIPADTLGALALEGQFAVPKATGGGTALTRGTEVYWDATNVRVTTDASGGKPRFGLVTTAASDDDATVDVLLTGGAAAEPATTTKYGLVKQAAVDTDLTDSTGGTANSTVVNVGTAVTGVDGTGANAASKADVDSRLTNINHNFADLVADLNDLRSKLRTAGVLASA